MNPTRRTLLKSVGVVVLIGAGTRQAEEAEMTTPDLILTNGRITTLDPSNPEAEAVAIGTDGFWPWVRRRRSCRWPAPEPR